MNVVITGASRGIGLGLVEWCLSHGHEVYALTRNQDRLRALKAKWPTQLYFESDLNKSKAIDLLINNAGVLLDEGESFSELSFSKIEESMRINVGLALQVTQKFLPQLKSANQPKVIFISTLMSSIADNGSGGYYSYRMSKAALNMMVKSFSLDEPSIISCLIHPGWVRTEMGGEQAPVSVSESVQGMMSLITSLELKNSGHFYDYEGDELPW